jgi:hypothetical protein
MDGYGQSINKTLTKLAEHGFENVSGTEDEQDCIYVIETSMYNVPEAGINKAMYIIRETVFWPDKPCTLIVLDNNVPQLSFTCFPLAGDSITREKTYWQASYNTDDKWRKVKHSKQIKNSSLYKMDITIYPELYFRNYIVSKVYELVVNISPVVELSFWRGMKLSAQVIFPVKNDYGERYNQIRPGFFTLSQSIRLPYRTFFIATAGTFNNFRWGADMRLKHILKDERFSLNARLGYTAKGYYDRWAYYYDKECSLTGSIGANFYLPYYNTQFSLNVERYLLKEYGVYGEMIRHFRGASIGFYATKVQHAGNNGFNGGFIFQIALSPYKSKRGKYPVRIKAGDFGVKYNAGNEEIYGRSYKTKANDNQMRDNSFNPLFIKSLNIIENEK